MGGKTAPRRSAAEAAAIPIGTDLAVGFGAGFTAAFCAAPFIMTVDKAVTQASAGTTSLWAALGMGLKEIVLRPHHLVRNPALLLVSSVYGLTYATANSIDTICERMLNPKAPSSATIQGGAKLFGTTAVNMGAGITKDALFARWFGAGDSATRTMPRATFGLFAVRDTLTIAAAFTVPPLVASALVSSGKMDEKRAADAAQLISPMGMQLICTPIHLMALEMFNKPDSSTGEKVRSAARMFPQSTIARMGRFCAAYGIGGLLNTALLFRGRDAVKQLYCGDAIVAAETDAPPPLAAGFPASSHVIVAAVQSADGATPKAAVGAPQPSPCGDLQEVTHAMTVVADALARAGAASQHHARTDEAVVDPSDDDCALLHGGHAHPSRSLAEMDERCAAAAVPSPSAGAA
uniref:Uncharacterized protein n=1 Tax=Strombidinopsis acuminata TaxID=141414 RepID=A0A7S3RHL3_9SPIT